MIYLASPYTSGITKDMTPEFAQAIMQVRYEQVRKVTAEYMRNFVPIFSPIVNNHEVAKYHDLPKEWDYWEKIDYMFLDASEELWVLMMDGWDTSKGVTAEIAYAEKIGIPVKYIPYEDVA